jgi:uncharacterized SAM-binding protein YcdF (DUF218 family)
MQFTHRILRGLALCLGLFAAVNLLASFRDRSFDPNLWWLDTRAMPQIAQDALVGVTAVLLLAWSIRPFARPWRRWTTLICLAAVTLIALVNAAAFYGVLFRGVIHTSLPFPFSLLVAALLSTIAWSVFCGPAPIAAPHGRAALPFLLAAAGFVLLFPMAQMFLFGKTDYRRPADAIVVLGARTHADGRPSLALADRVRTGCELYQQGYAPLVIMTGGPGDGDTHETVAMQTLAQSLGVPPSAIIRDEQGANTDASIRNLDRIAHERGLRRILAVSHYWHLPRIKLAVGRRDLQLFTVPATESRYLGQTPRMIVREIAAFWKYYATILLIPQHPGSP